MTDIAELALKVDARQVKDANAELDRMSTASKKVDKDVDTFSSNTNSKLASITRSLGLVAAGFASLSTVRSLLDASIQLEKFNNALQVATGSAKGAAEEMAFVRAESDRLGLNLQTTADQYSRLAAAAKGTELQGQATRDIFTSVAQAATVMGLSAAETGGALTALEQIISKGKVSAEELRGQLGERLPGAFQIAARSIGVTTAELDKLLSTGNLTAEQLLPALAAELNRTFGSQAEQAAQGLNAQINRFNTAIFNLKIAIGELGLIELFNAGIQVVTSFVNVINTRLLPAVKSVAEFINSIPVVSTVVKAAFGGGWLAAVKSANAETQALNTNLAKTESVAKSINIEAPVIKAAKATRTLNKELNDQKREAERTADEIKRLTREYDPLFKRNEELARLIELRAKGLPESIFNSAAAAAINDYIAAIGKTEVAIEKISTAEETVLDKTRNFWDTNEQIWIQGVRNVQTSLANGLFNIFDDGLKGMVNGVKRAVGQMIAEFASIKILQSTGIAGLLGMGSTAAFASGGASAGGGLGALNLASLGSSAFNLVQGGFGLTGAIGGGLQSLGGAIGSNSLFQFGAGVGGDLLAAGGAGSVAGGLGASLGSVAGPLAIAGIADIGLRQLFGDKKLGGTAGDVLSFVPVIGTLINGLFGHGAPKFQNEALVGNVGAGGFEGVLNQQFREKGGAFRGDRVSNFIADTDTGDLLNQFGRLSESGNIHGVLRDSATDPAVKRALEVGEFLDEAFGSIGNTLQQTADKLGLSADALNNFSAELDLVSEKGETLSEAQIGDEIARISDEMAKTLIPNLDEFAKTGESATETVVRLGNQFAVLENAVSAIFGVSGQSAEDIVNQFTIPDQTAFLDAAGGIESFSQKINQFIEGLPDTDKLDILQTSLSEALSAVGVDFIPTMDQFRDAMKSGELSAEQFLAGLDLQGALQQYEDLSNAVAEPLNNVIEPLNNVIEPLNNVIERIGAASQTAIDPADQLLSKLDALGLGALDTSKELIDAIKSQGESAGLTETQFDGLVKAMDETSGGIESLIDAERKLADERERAAALDRREFVAGRRAGETRDAAKAQEEIDRMVEARFTHLQNLADHFAKASAARELSFGDNGALNADQFVDILRNDPRVNDLAASDFGFDVREFFDLKSIQAKYGDLLRQDVDGVFEILQDAVIDGFKAQFGSGADQIRALKEQLDAGDGDFASNPADQERIARERIGLETQLLQLQGDTAALRQRELDALDESNRELLQRIFNLQDEQQRIAEAEQARAAIAQERAGLETQLMQLMGDTEDLRQRELEAIDGSNRGLLQRIFNLQDEQAEQQRLAAIAQERAGLETQLMQLQGDTAGLRQRELGALDETNRSILERIFALQDENAELERQRAIADERFGLETQLLTLQGDTAGLRQRELDALDESNRALLERIFALQDAAIAEEDLARQQEKNISNTFGVLQRSIDAEKNKLAEEYNKQLSITQGRIRDVSESLGKLTQLSGLLNQGIEALNPLSQQSARAQLQEAIQGAQKGIFPDAANLGRAVTTLTSLGTDSFSSREDFIRAQSENANLLKELSGFVEAEKTLEERTLDAITAQADRLQAGFNAEIGRLDGILDSAKTQIDILNGIDVSIKSVADAIAAFNSASTAAGGGEISAGAGGLLADTGATDDPLKAVRKIVRNIGGTDFNLAGFGLQRENDILGQRVSFSKGGGLVRADFEAGVLTLLDDAKNVIHQEVFDDLTKLDEVSKLNATTLAKKYDLPAFATGADFVPFTGPAIVHKGERIINNDQNRDIVDALKQLVQSVSKSTESNERLRKMIRDSLVETDDGFAQRTSAPA